MTRGEFLYKEFIKNFPSFESMVKSYKKNGKNSIEIETVANKKFIFKITNNKNEHGIELHPV